MNILQKFNMIICEIAKENSVLLPQIDMNDSENEILDMDLIDDYGFDSIMLITMVVRIEETFKITLPDEMLIYENMKSYRMMCELVLQLVEEVSDSE